MKYRRWLVWGGLVGFLAFPSEAQTVVEHSVATGAATAGAAGASGVSKSIGDVFNNLNKTLSKTEKSDTGDTRGSASSVIGTSPLRDTTPSRGMRIGTERADLVERFGKPFMKTSRVEGPTLIETYYYKGAEDIIVVTLRDGKVISVVPPQEEDLKRSASRKEPVPEKPEEQKESRSVTAQSP